MNQLYFTASFLRESKKLTKRNPKLRKQIAKTFAILRQDPFYPSLKSHKALKKSGEEIQSSWVNQDIRIIWKFNKGSPTILDILDIGGHSGSKKVYK